MSVYPKYILSLAVLAPMAYGWAQTPLNQDVQVTREYTPTVMDVNKVEQMPTLDDTSTYRPTFNYMILSKPFETTQGIEPISPARLAADKKNNLTNSVAKFGFGTSNSLLGRFNYNILRSNLYALGLEVNHQSALGTLELEDGSDSKAPYSDTYAGLNFKRFFNKVTLSSQLGFQHNLFDYYGYRSLRADSLYLIDGKNDPVEGSELLPDRHQRFGLFSFGLALQNTGTEKTSAQWAAGLGFSSFGNKTGVNQNKFDISANASFPVSSFRLKLDAGVSAYSTTVPESDSLLFIFTETQKTAISISPRLEMPFEGGSVEAGLLMVAETGNNDDQMHVAPVLTANLRIADGIVSIYGGLKGNYFQNDYVSVAYENPFVSPDLTTKSSFHGIDLHAGLKGSFSASVTFNARVDYSFFNDEHFFVNRYWERNPLSPTATEAILDYHNLFGVVYDDGKLLKVAGELFIAPSDALNVKLQAGYYGWQLENELEAWHKPETELGISAFYKINKSLSAQASVNFLGARYAKVPAADPVKKLKGYADINASVNYKLARSWNLWASVNNLAAANYFRWNGYPSYKLTTMVGASYSF
ncbi:MAG: hypothetical protein QM786_08920 [Breznakibacter sp.]